MSPLDRFRAFAARRSTLLAVYLAAAAAVALQMYLRHTYGNFLIFRLSFEHLLGGEDLYLRYPETNLDLLTDCSPTFSLLFAPFAVVPVPLGMLAWSLLNAWVLYQGLVHFPFVSESRRVLALWLCLAESLGALQHMQTNALIAGLLLLAFCELERERTGRGTFLVLLTVFIKLFGAVGLTLGAFARRRARMAAAAVAWTALLTLLPLAVTSPSRLAGLYRSWLGLVADHSVSYGYSVLGILHSWFGLDPDKLLVLAAGAALMALPFLRVRAYREPAFRSLALAALLIWCVIFNHKAEGATYIIAMAGVVVWYGSAGRSRLDLALLVLAVVLVSVAPSDLFAEVRARPLRGRARAQGRPLRPGVGEVHPGVTLPLSAAAAGLEKAPRPA